MTGGIVFFPGNSTNAQGLNDFIRSLDAEKMPYELLSAQDVVQRWPQFELPPGVDAVYTHDFGILHASKSVTAMQFLARFSGAILREKTKVNRVVPRNGDGGYLIKTSKGQLHAKR